MAAQRPAKKSAKTAKQPAKKSAKQAAKKTAQKAAKKPPGTSARKTAKRAVGKAARKAAAAAEKLLEPAIPGTPGVAPAPLEEPTEARAPLPPKPDQGTPDPRTPTGAKLDADPTDAAQQDAFLTTATGVRLLDSDHSLKAGPRGPTLLQDHHLREKITHFDHERIPERVVHARGAGAHGVFEGYGTADDVTVAGFLAKGKETPVFVRFSTVLGSRGSADTVRDTRGFATKFYTDEGTFDLVGNNIPVFFIQDGIKFPDVIHAAKPHPDREIPQAQSAHDTFWDFVSLHTEGQHHTIWNMSDRGIPRSYRMMEGFGVHTFRCTNADGRTSLVKFHWKPVLGVHSLTWEEAQMLAGLDPDFHRRDLYDAIESGAFPQWELGVQVFEDTDDQLFAGIDLLDPTKLVPEELAEVQPIGRLTLNAQPDELLRRDRAGRVPRRPPGARHRRHRRPADAGAALLLRRHPADPAGRPELQPDPDQPAARAGQRHAARRLPPAGGPRRRRAVQAELARRRLPVLRRRGGRAIEGAFVDSPVRVAEATKVRANPASYDDHYSQARQFWLSMTPVEKEHIVRAYTFELGKCYEQAIKERQLLALANIDPVLCQEVATGLGLPAPKATIKLEELDPSPALSQLGGEYPPDGRTVGIVIDPDGDLSGIGTLRATIDAAGMVPLLIAPHGGTVDGMPVQRTFATGRSVEFDVLLVAGAPIPAPDALPARDEKAGADETAAVDPRVLLMLEECYRHAKVIGAWGDGVRALDAARCTGAAGVVTGDDAATVFAEVQTLMSAHRVWERFPSSLA